MGGCELEMACSRLNTMKHSEEGQDAGWGEDEDQMRMSNSQVWPGNVLKYQRRRGSIKTARGKGASLGGRQDSRWHEPTMPQKEAAV